MDNNKKTDWAEVINWTLTIILIVVLIFAVQQRYFEDNKCKAWSKDKVMDFIDNGNYYSVNMNDVVDELNSQQINVADKSATPDIQNG